MNTTALIPLNYSGPITQNVELRIEDVVRDVCQQVDGKIVFGLLAIVTYWYLSRVMGPISLKAWEGIANKQLSGIIQLFYKHALSFMETLMLGFSVVITGYWIIQNGWSTSLKVYAVVMGILSLLVYYYYWKRTAY